MNTVAYATHQDGKSPNQKYQVWSKRLADVERIQVSHGVDPDHDLDDVS